MIYKNVYIGSKDIDNMKFVIDRKHFMRLIDVRHKTVMDVGGFIGAFAVRCIDAGACKVISYEPTTSSFKLLSKNAERVGGIKAINRAVVADGRKKIVLAENPKYAASNSCAHHHRASTNLYKVGCVDLYKEIDKHRPAVLKVDCEGGEYGMLDGRVLLSSSVTQVVVELHYITSKKIRPQFDRLVASFANWEAVRTPRGTWHNELGCWRR